MGAVSDAATIILVLAFVLCIVAAVAVMLRWLSADNHRRGRRRASLPAVTGHESTTLSPGDEASDGVLALPTERPNEIYLFGRAAELDEYGATLASAPSQLARYASGLKSAVDGVRSYGELSGRLVLVDDKTAAALKAGTMMKDKGGEILAHVLRDDGKISSVTRLREVGGLAAGAASLTNAMSAMAMQAQLDRIERQLTVISEGIDTANRELLRQWHAQALGAQDVLREVYATATRAGELTAANWTQVASIGHVVRTQIHGDRDRLSHAIADLEQLASAPDVKERMKELDSKVDAVRSAHVALSESTRTWAQYSALRLWHFTVTGDPTLEAYRAELHLFIKSSRNEIEPLRLRASAAVSQVAKYRWTSMARHPLIVRRLPAASADRLATLEAVNWQPLELRQPKEIEPPTGAQPNGPNAELEAQAEDDQVPPLNE